MLLSAEFLTHPTWNAVSHSSGESTYRMVRVRIKFRVGFRDRIRGMIMVKVTFRVISLEEITPRPFRENLWGTLI